VVEVSAVVRNRALAAGAGEWLDGLDDLVADLSARWDLEVGEPFADGTEAFVAPVTRGDGTPAVLKVVVPRDADAVRHEATVLRLAGGDGCARLLDADPDVGALLLERLGPSMADLDPPYPEGLDALGDLARRVWRPAPDAGLPTGAEKASWLADFVADLWVELDRPCAEATVDGALASAWRRAVDHDDERAVLVHGDVHRWNALRRDDSWALVDPDGLLADPAYDVGVILREDPEELLAAGPVAVTRRLAARCGVDPVAAWEWAAIERVSTGLLCTRIDLHPVGREMLAAADALAGLDP